MDLKEAKSIFDIIKIFSQSPVDVYTTLTNAQLIQTIKRCSNNRCRRQSTVLKDKSTRLGFIFRCKSCKRKSSLTVGTFLERMKLSLSDIFILMFSWCCDIHLEGASSITGVDYKVTAQYYGYFREIASWKVTNAGDYYKFGGDSVIVQLQLYQDFDKWILCIYDTEKKRGILKVIKDLSPKILFPIIKEHVKPGTQIWTDSSEAFQDLGNPPYNYIHLTIDKDFYSDINVATCMNAALSLWSSAKRYLNKHSITASNNIEQYLETLAWRKWWARGNAQTTFRNLLEHIADCYPVPTA